MKELLALGIIYKSLEAYADVMLTACWSQALFEVLGRPHKPACTIQAQAIVEHDRILNDRG